LCLSPSPCTAVAVPTSATLSLHDALPILIRYYIKLGVLSIRKNPVLSALMVAAIAVGISACMTILNINYVMSGNPIPHRSDVLRSEEHTSELQSRENLVCRLLLEKKKAP